MTKERSRGQDKTDKRADYAFFSDVIDRGEIQNQCAISEKTHWHSDGTFASQRWREVRDDGR